MSTISTHILDSATGLPAAGMRIELLTAQADGGWLSLGVGSSDLDGRLKSAGDSALGPGNYRLVFGTGTWFAKLGRDCFYPEVIISFTVDDDDSHYHVPLLLSAYAYSTYRGS